MTFRDLDINFPFRGVGQFRLNKDKGNSFAQDAENVLGESPLTGKQQGGQRWGSSQFTNGKVKDGSKVQAGISVSHDRPAFTFAALGKPRGDLFPVPILEDWGLQGTQLDAATDVRTDDQGNSYGLSSSGVVVKRNSAGDVTATAILPTNVLIAPAPRFALQADGGFLAAGSSTSGARRAVLWRFRPDTETDGLFLTFSLELKATSVEAIEIINESSARVAVNSANATAEILTILGIDGEDPTIVQRHSVPYPVGDVAIGPRGTYACCRPNASRGKVPAGDGFVESAVDWTPMDLTNAAERVHAWFEPEFVAGAVDGGRLVRWPDYRLSGDFTVPYDDTDRGLLLAEYTTSDQSQGPLGPTWFQAAAGPNPGVSFWPAEGELRPMRDVDRDNGNALQSSNENVTSFPLRGHKVNAQGTLRGSRGLWPLNDASYKFAICFAVRWVDGAQPGTIWLAGAYRDAGSQAGDATDGLGPSDGYLALTINDDGSATAAQLNGGVALRGPALPGGTVTGAATSHGSTPLRMAIITLVQNGSGAFSVRVNGTSAATGLTVDDSGFVSPTEFLGNRVYYENDAQLSAGFLPGVDSLNGVICAAVTIFGDSSVGVHDVAVSAAEVEQLEGYLAHRFGCAADALDPLHTYHSAPPVGTGSGPSSTATSQALRSPYGIVLKLDPSGEGATWAVAGAGMGFALATDQEGGVFSVGPRSVPPSYPETLLGPVSRTRLRLVDRGVTADWTEPSSGRIRFRDNPVNGDYFTVSDGTSSVTFEFQSGGVATIPGAVVVNPGSGSIYGHVVLCTQALATTSLGNFDAQVEGLDGDSSVDLVIWSKNEPTGVATPIVISCPISNAFALIDGMTASRPFPDGSWQGLARDAYNPLYPYMRLAVDFKGDLYVPWGYSAAANHLTKYRGASGFETWTHPIGGVDSGFTVRSVSVDPNEVDLYPARGPEFAWVASSNEDLSGPADVATQTKLRLISSTSRSGPDRQVTTLVVAGGDVLKISRSGVPELVAAGEFDGSSGWVQAATQFGEVFFVDNGRYRVFNLKAGTLKEWKPKTAGEMPEGARLVASYRNRMVLARTKKDPYGLYASAHGDPYDWDARKALDTPTAAFRGIRERRNPDVVTALAPFYDDRLVIGGSNSIQVFSGDLSTEGSINLFTDAMGMSFGLSYALGSDGLLYFFGSRGGVFVMSPTSDGRANPPQEISDFTVGRELKRIDLSNYRPRLVYDAARRGLHLLMVYIGEGVAPTASRPRHWFWDEKRKAWWPITYSGSLGDVVSAWEQRGELLDDRVINLGWSDGSVRFLDDGATGDDGEKIDSWVLLGPILATDAEITFRRLQLEVSWEGGEVEWSTHASDDPEQLGEALDSGRVQPGFSGRISLQGRGAALWLRLGGANVHHSWALGEVRIAVEPVGIRHSREGIS